MCVIIYKPSKVDIDRKTLHECWEANPDSGGFMFADDGKLKIIKGFLSFGKFYKKYRECEGQCPESNFVIHFRIATYGKVDQANCHPFLVNGDVGFAHNGILGCVNVPKDSSRSDTRLFCEQVLKLLPRDFLSRREYRILLESTARNEHSKFAFLTSSGVCHILNESAGVWRGGCWYSNDFWQSIGRDVWATSTSKAKDVCIIDNEKWSECCCCGDYLPVSEIYSSEEDGYYVCSSCTKELEEDAKKYRKHYLYKGRY